MKTLTRLLTVLSIFITVSYGVALLLIKVPAFGLKAFTVSTSSMRPTMPPGTLVLVHSVPTTKLQVGDVITFVNPRNIKQTITHRILGKTTIGGKVPGFITKGDANNSADNPIVAGSVLGKRIWFLPHAGNILKWVKTVPGLLVIIWLPALLIIIDELRRLAAYYKSQQPYVVTPERLEHSSLAGESNKIAGLAKLTTFLIFSAALIGGVRAFAMLKSNTVVLANNRLITATTPPGTCTGNTNNTNVIDITNNNNQTASSGNASSSGNATGGSATSGDASNSSSTTVNITITNCH